MTAAWDAEQKTAKVAIARVFFHSCIFEGLVMQCVGASLTAQGR
jgi:hypothetical protein